MQNVFFARKKSNSRAKVKRSDYKSMICRQQIV